MEHYSSIENLEQLKVYQLCRDLSRLVWDIVLEWDYFAKKTIGSQWVESTDSTSANVAEGYGCFHFYDSIKFYYYSRGSLFESYDWFLKAKERNLLTDENIKSYFSVFNEIPVELNMLIKRTRDNAEKYRKKGKTENLL